MKFENGKCVPPLGGCPSGTKLEGDKCVLPAAPEPCPTGMKMIAGQCVTDVVEKKTEPPVAKTVAPTTTARLHLKVSCADRMLGTGQVGERWLYRSTIIL